MPDGTSVQIADMQVGRTVTTFLALRSKQLRERDDRPFICFEFADSTGRIMAVVGENVDAVWSLAEENDVVKVRARVDTWNGKKTLRVQRLRKAQPEEFDPAAFVPSYPGDVDELWAEFVRAVESLSSAPLRAAMEHAIDARELLAGAPAGKLWHHVYVGGLLEHSNSVASLVDHACSRYPLASRDLAVAGALLHDVGKARAFRVSTTIDYSDEGRLIGHVVLGERMVRAWCAQTPEMDDALAEQLCHIVLSHQRLGDHPSPVQPATLEASLVASANEMDATAGAFARIIERERDSGQDWSEWVNTLKRHIHLNPYR